MPQLQLYLLGPPRIESNSYPIRMTRRKSLALLSYLAIAGEPQPRDALAALLWPESAKALGLLRRELWDLNQILGGDWLVIERMTIGLRQEGDVWIDARQFESHVASVGDVDTANREEFSLLDEQLSAAIDLYRGDFLTGFTISDSPEFDQWQFFQADHYRQRCTFALEALIGLHHARHDYDKAIANTRRLLALDSFNESTHRRMMLLNAQAGHQAAAIRQYQECKRLLETELNVQPEDETDELYEAIRQRKIGAQPKQVEPLINQPPLPPQPVQGTIQSDAPALPRLAAGELRIVTLLYARNRWIGDDIWNLKPDEMAEQVDCLLQLMITLLSPYQVPVEHLSIGGVLAVFGALQIHEDDPERAITVALAMQNKAQDLALDISIAISTGLVYIGQIGSQKRFETTVTGTVVNLVTQLQDKAESGKILVSNATYRYTRRAFHFEPVIVRVTGIPEPVTAHQVIRPYDRAEKSRGIEGLRAGFIGRNDEVTKLTEMRSRVLAGSGQIVLLSGDAGVGKSRLVAELKAIIKSENQLQPDNRTSSQLLWLEGRCQEMTENVAYQPFRDFLHTYFAWEPEDGQQVRAARLLARLQNLMTEGHLSAEQVETIGPLLGNLFSLHFSNEWDERLQNARPEQIRYQTLQALHDLLIALARHQPLILVLEDLHWADSSSMDLITQLMQSLPSIPLLLLCVYRPEQEHRCWQLATIASRRCPGHFIELPLRELTPQQSHQMLTSLLSTTNLPVKIQELTLQRSHGNPFFAEEIIYSLIDSGLLYREGDVWHAHANVNKLTVPESVQSVVLSRVDRLDLTPKQILQRAAVIGRLFPLQLLTYVASQEADLSAHLTVLTEAALIYQEQAVPEILYSFRHVLAQEAIYLTIPRGQRMELHQQVGRALEQFHQEDLAAQYEQLAYHFDRSEEREKAVEYLLKAGEKARRNYLNEEAIDYYQRALGHLKKLPIDPMHQERLLITLTGLGLTHYRGTGQLDEAENYIRQAITLAKTIELPPRQLVRLYLWLGDIAMNWQPRYEETLRIGEEGLAFFDADEKSVEVALMNALISFGHGMLGDLRTARIVALRMVSFAADLPYSEEIWLVYNAIFFAYFRERELDPCRFWLGIILQRATEQHDLLALGEACFNLARVQACQGNLIESLASREQGLNLLGQGGDVKRRNWCQIAMAWVHLFLGNLKLAEQYAVEALESALAVNEQYLCDLHLCLGTVAMARNEWEKAETLFEQAEQYREATNPAGIECQGAWGHVCLQQGKFLQAIEHFRRAASSTLPWPAVVEWRISWSFQEIATPFADALTGLEIATPDRAQFRAYCNELRAGSSETENSPFVQWYLEPAHPSAHFPIYPSGVISDVLGDLSVKLDDSTWTWRDPLGDSTVSDRDGLIICATNGRNLWFNNWSAPCLLRPQDGDFAAQTSCISQSPEKPAMGGILLWRNNQNYLRLDWGSRGTDEITLLGCLDNKDVIIGRGQLPQITTVTPIFLRMEQTDQCVRALCSADGESWFSVGQAKFLDATPLEVGLYATGNIDRVVYPSAFPNGTAIRFSGFWLSPPLSGA